MVESGPFQGSVFYKGRVDGLAGPHLDKFSSLSEVKQAGRML